MSHRIVSLVPMLSAPDAQPFPHRTHSPRSPHSPHRPRQRASLTGACHAVYGGLTAACVQKLLADAGGRRAQPLLRFVFPSAQPRLSARPCLCLASGHVGFPTCVPCSVSSVQPPASSLQPPACPEPGQPAVAQQRSICLAVVLSSAVLDAAHPRRTPEPDGETRSTLSIQPAGERAQPNLDKRDDLSSQRASEPACAGSCRNRNSAPVGVEAG